MAALASDMGYQPAGRADLALGAIECRDVDGRQVLIARAQSGEYFAVAPQCSHSALPLLGGRVRGVSIVCPHHGARFDLKSGRVLGPPAHQGIAAYPTREQDGEVQIWLF